MTVALIVHGGAWEIPDDQVAAHEAGCAAALEAGYALLAAGGSALDAVEAAVRIMEDAPIFDAGTGSVLTSTGTVELDAALMVGSSLHYGAIANVRHIRNPITLARRVLEGPATMLVGEGAEAFAVRHGIALIENRELIVPRELALWQRWRAGHALPPHGHDTVGAIALDAQGEIVAANSTGGTPFKLPGRVGDTPLIGCGLYADSAYGAVVCTGRGELIVRMALARRAMALLEAGANPQAAAEGAVAALAARADHGGAGCIVLGRDGQFGCAYSTSRMAIGFANSYGQRGLGTQFEGFQP